MNMVEPQQTKKAIVTGGAGFIGSHLCQSLVKDGYQVTCVDNFITGSKNNVADLLNEKNFTLIHANVIKKLSEAITDEPVDYIFHLASPASPNELSDKSYMHLPLETMDVNSIGTRRLLRLAKRKNAKFLYASTSEIYGDPTVHPQPESYWGNVNPNGPRSCYDESKRFGEALTMVYVNKMKVDARIVRIFNTYGPKMDSNDGRATVNFIVQAIKGQPITIYGKGSQTRSLCYVDDMVIGLKKAMFMPKTQGEVINLGNPEELTVLALAKKVKKLTNSNSKIVFSNLPVDDPEKRKPDIAKAKKLLNWQPKIKLSQGLEKMIEYFQKQLKNE
ncbi:MAG: UDP-glucuronic acid decarboxylase family protein [Patescibacteria group bacterium]